MSTTQTDRQNDGQVHTERQRCNLTMKQFDFIAQFKMINVSTRVNFLFFFLFFEKGSNGAVFFTVFYNVIITGVVSEQTFSRKVFLIPEKATDTICPPTVSSCCVIASSPVGREFYW